jgi:hypothetical protein
LKLRTLLLCLALAAGLAALPAWSAASPHGAGPAIAKKRHCHWVRSHGRRRRACRKRPPKGPEALPPTPPTPPPAGGGSGGPTQSPLPPKEEPYEEPGGGPGGPPSEFETVDLVANPSFEGADEPTGCFVPNGTDGEVSSDTGSPLAGQQSLHAKLKAFGRIACGHEYGEGEGPIVKKVTLEGDVRIDAPSVGEGLKVCAVVYYDGNPQQEEKCQTLPLSDHSKAHVALSDEIEEKRIHRVFFQLEAGGKEIEATLDEAHLAIERKKGSEGHGGGGGGGGGGPGSNVGRFAAMVSPTDGETFTTPLNLRLIGIGHDPNIFTNQNKKHEDSPGHGTNAAEVEFLLDGRAIGRESGEEAEYHVFKTFAFAKDLDVAPGQHTVVARAIYEEPAEAIESKPATINVVAPSDARTVDLTEDVVLDAAHPSFELEGSPTERIKLNGNGHRIVSTGTGGHLALKYVDVQNLGDPAATASPSIDVTTTGSGGATIENSSFDFSNGLRFRFDGSSTARLDDNLFRSNMRMPIGQEPGDDPTSPTVPAISIFGSSTAHKEFAGNNVAAAPVKFELAHNWTIGGPTDADSNVLIGARAAFEVLRSSDVTIEGNFVNHNYYGGWSQGQLMEVGGTTPIAIQHNVLMDSSWPVRGIAGEFAYNLVLEAGHQWMVPDENGHPYIHNNIFVGGDNDRGGITGFYPTATRVENNTFDGQESPSAFAAVMWQMGDLTLDSNAFVNFPTRTAAVIDKEDQQGEAPGTIRAEYNGFFNPQTTNYTGGVAPSHDLNGGAPTDPRFAGPLPKAPFEMDKAAVWKRQLPVSQILSAYRTFYTPTQGSPYIDAGDPGVCACNDIGAIGAGPVPNPLDRFGSFSQPGWTPPPTPPAP